MYERPGPGLYSKWVNPFIGAGCIELLKWLKTSIKLRGFNYSHDELILKMVFGDGALSYEGLAYAQYSKPSNPTKEISEFDLPPEERKAKFIGILEEEISRLENLLAVMGDLTAMRERMVTRCSGVPEATRLDRMLRYEASLERAFDRALSQLERLQRNRRGQFVPPEQQLRVTVES